MTKYEYHRDLADPGKFPPMVLSSPFICARALSGMTPAVYSRRCSLHLSGNYWSETPTAYSGDFLKVKKAEILDDYTFRVTYDQPFAPALIVGELYLPGIFWQERI